MSIDIVETLLLSLKVALVGVGVSGVIGIGLAYILAKFDFPGKALLSALTLMPLVMPPVVTGFVLLSVMGPQSVVGAWLGQFGIVFGFRWTGAALAAGLLALPLIIRPVRIAFETVDSDLHEALAMAGLGRWQRFLRLDLPLAWPGIVAGLVLGFAKALGEFGATITFVANIPGETRTLSLAIHSALQSFDGADLVLILSAISIGISLIAVIASEVIISRLGKARGGVKRAFKKQSGGTHA